MLPATKSSVPVRSRAASGAAWIFMEMCGLQGMSLLFFSLLAHALTPHDFGLMSMCFVATMAVRVVVQERIPEAVAVRVKPTDDEWTAAFWLSVVAGIILTALLLASANILERLMGTPGLAPVLRPMSLLIVCAGFSRTHEAWLSRHFEFRALALRGVVGAVVGGIAGIAWAFLVGGVYTLVLQQIIGSLVSLVLVWMSCSWRPAMRIRSGYYLRIVKYSRDTLPGSLTYVVSESFDVIIVGFYFGIPAAGLYSVAKRLRLALQMLVLTPMNGVILPLIADARGNPGGVDVLVRQVFTIASVAYFPIFVGASFVAPGAVYLAFGSKWSQAAPIFAVLALGVLGRGLQACSNAVLTTHEHPRWPSYLAIAETGFALSLSYFCASSLGPTAVAAAFVAPLAFSVPLSGMMAMRILDIPIYRWWRMMAPGFIGSAAMVFCLAMLSSSLLNVSALVRLVSMVAIGSSLYLVILRFMFRSGFEEIMIFVQGAMARLLQRHRSPAVLNER